jgi:uncharacterized membrane protein
MGYLYRLQNDARAEIQTEAVVPNDSKCFHLSLRVLQLYTIMDIYEIIQAHSIQLIVLTECIHVLLAKDYILIGYFDQL